MQLLNSSFWGGVKRRLQNLLTLRDPGQVLRP